MPTNSRGKSQLYFENLRDALANQQIGASLSLQNNLTIIDKESGHILSKHLGKSWNISLSV